MCYKNLAQVEKPPTNRIAQPKKSDLTGCRVLILTGLYEGREGVCVGKSADGKRWAISPDDSDEILQLVFEKDFGLLVDLSSNPEAN